MCLSCQQGVGVVVELLYPLAEVGNSTPHVCVSNQLEKKNKCALVAARNL